MDPERARQLLGRERDRIEKAIAALSETSGQAASEQGEPGEFGSEELYEKEFDTCLAEDLSEQLAALERAEARLAAGSYGLSVDSGRRSRIRALKRCRRLSARSRSSRHSNTDGWLSTGAALAHPWSAG